LRPGQFAGPENGVLEVLQLARLDGESNGGLGAELSSGRESIRPSHLGMIHPFPRNAHTNDPAAMSPERSGDEALGLEDLRNNG